jgi:predicted alpha/beta hydrolase family esterase
VGIVVIAIELVIIRYLIQSNVATCIRECVELQTEEIAKFEPDVIVASSFGGGIAVHLLSRGLWKGATLLLAPAQYPRKRKNSLFNFSHNFSFTACFPTDMLSQEEAS